MKKTDQKKSKSEFYHALMIVALSVLAVYSLIWAFTGDGLFKSVTYDSYLIQAERWLSGHLDLGQNYSYLEIAEYNGKFFISFPPIPSVILLPFVFLFGLEAPAHLIAVVIGLIGAAYALRLAFKSGLDKMTAIMFTLLLTVGSNFLHIGYRADVWYFAQICAFAFTMMSLYYAFDGGEKRGWLALLFLALAVGCRPLNMVYLPLVLWFILSGVGIKYILKKFTLWILPPLGVGLFLMLLNYLRFDNPFEFGHNYLPEFAKESVNGQFHTSYISENLSNMFRLPELEDGRLVFPTFNGVALWLVSPIFLVWAVLGIHTLIKKGYKDPAVFKKDYKKPAVFKKGYKDPAVWLLVALPMLHIVLLCAHKTLGGWQFGNRYTVDLLPCIFFAIMYFGAKRKNIEYYMMPLLFWGMCVNLVGTIALMQRWI